MFSEDAGQTQTEDDHHQGLTRLDVSQTPSINSGPPSSFPRLQVPTTAPTEPQKHQGPPTLPKTNFLGLPREIRNMVYAQILTVDQNPLLHANIEESSRFDAAILQTNHRVRDEAFEILGESNVWIILVINCHSSRPRTDFLSRLLCIPANRFQPRDADWLSFHQRKNIVIEVGYGCGARNLRPLRAPHHSERCLVAYDRQSFAYLCLKLWEGAPQWKFMTVIWHIPSSWPESSQVLGHVESSLSAVRGFRRVACIAFPDQSLARRLERQMTMTVRLASDVFTILRHYHDNAQAALDAGRHGQAVHIYCCARRASLNLFCSLREWLSVPPHIRNAFLRISADMAVNSSRALFALFSDVQNVSMERFWKLSDNLIDDGVGYANAALGWPGITDIQRMEAHQSRGNAFRFRTEYYSRNGRAIEGKEAQVRSDYENAAIDLYHASKLVDDGIHPPQPPVGPSLSHIEERHLKCTRADTIARVDFRRLSAHSDGTVWQGDGRLLREWELTEDEFCENMLDYRSMPPTDQTMGLI